MSAQPEPEIAVRAGARLGQAPTWDPANDTLLWVDVLSSTVHRHVPGGEDHVLEVPQHVSAAKPRSMGGLVLHLTEGIALFEANGDQRTWLVYWARDGYRGGDATVDSHGRLWTTTVPDEGGRHVGAGRGWLATVTTDGRPRLVLDDAAALTGLAFSPDGARLYVADGPTRGIDVFDVDPATGETSNRRPFVLVEDTPGEPAGLCTDAEGYVWVTIREGGEVRRYTPDGVVDHSIRLPVANPTGCCFGGPDLADLYVTSAREGTGPADESTENESTETAGPESGDDSRPDEHRAHAVLDGSLLVLPGAGEGLRTPFFAG